jgi:uncharacterized protein DUF2442
MQHPIFRVVALALLGDYRLRIGFDDSSFQVIDFEPILKGELYGPLRDPELFAAVDVDSEVGTLIWPNGADFDPATLHDWPACGPAMGELARNWALAAECGS